MCTVSMIMDDWSDRWKQRPYYPQQINPIPYISPTEFDQLKKEVEILREQLIRAKEYDKKNNEPDCELEEKIVKVREIAKLVGIDLDEILKHETVKGKTT